MRVPESVPILKGVQNRARESIAETLDRDDLVERGDAFLDTRFAEGRGQLGDIRDYALCKPFGLRRGLSGCVGAGSSFGGGTASARRIKRSQVRWFMRASSGEGAAGLPFRARLTRPSERAA